MLGLDTTGDAIIVAMTEPDGVVWKLLSIKDGAWESELVPHNRFTELVRPDGHQRMIGMGLVGDKIRYEFSDHTLQADWDWTVRVFGYQRVELISMSADHSQFLVKVQGLKPGYGYFLSNTKEHLTKRIGAVYAGVTQIAEVNPIKYPAADALEIPAYLTLPSDRPAKNLPLVVLPHGGPQARDTLGFDW